MNVTARKLLATLENDTLPEGGLACLDRWRDAALDGSGESLTRLDQVLQAAREMAPAAGALATDPQWINFARLAAFYLGEHIARELQQDMQWFSRAAARQALPADFGLPDAFFSEVVGVVDGMVCLPLGHVQAALTGPELAPPSADYVADFLARVRAPAPDENEWAARYLRSLEDGSYLPGGLAMRERLAQLQLDFSRESLARVDAFLEELRREQHPSYGDFVNRPFSSNLVLVLGYYLAATVARVGGLSLKWLTYPEIRQHVPELEFNFETGRGVVLDGRLFFPLQAINGRLFSEESGLGCMAFADRVLSHAPRAPVSSLRRPPPGAPEPSVELPRDWARAFRAAGSTAAFHMYLVESGAPFVPTLTQPTLPEGARHTTLMYADMNEAVNAGMATLDANDEGLPFQLFAYDSFANLPQGRIDALCLELRCYGQWPLALTLAIPYRAATPDRRFTLHSPKLVGCSASPFPEEALAQAFYAGVEEVKLAGFSWAELLDESI